MTDYEPPYSVALNTGGPADPQYVLEVAQAFAQSVRVLNHLTLHHEALEYPSEADRLIREIATAASRLPQLLGQVSRWLGQEMAEGRLRIPEGEYQGRPDMAAVAAMMRLDEAGALAEHLREALDGAASVTATMGAVETEDDDDE